MKEAITQLFGLSIDRGYGMAMAIMLCAGILAGCIADGGEPDRSPEAEARSFRFADPDLRISLVAAEPDIISPVAMAWAPNGDLFVVEMPGYPMTDKTGRIKRLTDPDGDGRYHLASIFAEGLSFPNSVMPYRGGVLVTDAPDILFLKDTDNDGVADVKEVVLTGFEPGNQQLRANDLYWGLDNWVYGANGRSGGAVHYTGDTREVSIDNRDFRFRPSEKEFEAISGLSQFGLAQDDWGNRFISYNHRFARQVVLEEKHLDRNPALSLHAIFDTGQNEHDRRVYTLLQEAMRFNRDPIGYFTSLSGLTAYRGHLLGADYEGDFFAGESVQAAVIRRRMQQEGTTFTALDAEPEAEFLASTDGWFHPVNFSNGPDGALYVVDFYRLFVEHPQWAHEDRREGVDWQMGEDNGRIWRIVHKDAEWDATRMKPDLHTADIPQLVAQLADPAAWRRDMAQQLLVEGRQEATALRVEKMLQHDVPLARSHALWTLEGLGLLTESHIDTALTDPVSEVKIQAIRLAESLLPESETLRRLVGELTGSEDQSVRFQAILAVGAVNTPTVKQVLIQRAGAWKDDWTRIALLSSTAAWAGDFARALLASSAYEEAQGPTDLAFFRQVGAMVADTVDSPEAGEWISRLTDSESRLKVREFACIVGYADARVSLGKSLPTFSASFFDQALSLGRDESNLSSAQIGIELLGYSRSEAVHRELLRLVWQSQKPEIQLAALQTVASLNQPSLSDALFEQLSSLDPPIRKALIASSLGSDAAVASLLTAIENEQIDPTEIPEELRHALLAHTDESLKQRATEIVGAAVDTDRQSVVDRYQASLAGQTVELKQGAALFSAYCSGCHAINGVGGLLGPDLTNIGNRTDEVLLVSILDPSRMVSYELRLTVVVTKSGEVFSGTVSAETVSSITIRQADGQEHTLLRENIQDKTVTGQSIMPEGFERMIDEADMANLIGFLRKPG